MKLSMLITLCSILIFTSACGQYGNESYNDPYANTSTSYEESHTDNYTQGNSRTRSNKTLKTFPVVNNTGQTVYYIPFPANWKVNTDSWVGPNNTVVKYYQGGMADAQQAGIFSIDQLIKQKFEPIFRQENTTITKMYDLPAVAKRSQINYSQYWKVAPTKDYFQVKAIEGKNQKGEKGLVIITYMLTQSQYGSLFNYHFNIMEAEAGQFEQAKNELIYALANVQLDRQYIANHNRNEQLKSQRSWSVHNSRMAQNQANFNARQKTQSTLSEVGDIYHNTWKNTSSMNDAGHRNTIDGIHGQNTMTNPYTGQDVKVEYGYDNYYMNSNNQYIGTNDAFYNPQNDQNVNNQNWRKMNPDNK